MGFFLAPDKICWSQILSARRSGVVDIQGHWLKSGQRSTRSIFYAPAPKAARTAQYFLAR